MELSFVDTEYTKIISCPVAITYSTDFQVYRIDLSFFICEVLVSRRGEYADEMNHSCSLSWTIKLLSK